MEQLQRDNIKSQAEVSVITLILYKVFNTRIVDEILKMHKEILFLCVLNVF